MSEKKKVLFDLNIDGDCTNLGSLAVLNALANKGEVEILATTACYKSPLATGCIKAVNEYYGNGDVPVGILHCQEETHPTNFPKPVNEKFFPDFPNGQEAPDTVEVMRKAIVNEPDESVICVVSGCFASLEALFRSEGDEISPLSGFELAKKKIKRIVIMAGAFNTFGDNEIFPENNVAVQVPAAQYVTEHWDKELILSAFEIGIRVRTFRELRLNAPDDNPLKMMYNILDGDGVGDNPSWDHTAVLEGVRPGQYFNYSEFGHISVDDKGITHWEKREGGKHAYLLPKVPFEDVASEINSLAFPEWEKYSAKRVCNFLKEAGVYYLATVDGDKPRVRPFGTAHILFGGMLYIQTGKKKDVSKQLAENHYAEICAFKDGEWVRISGELVEDDNVVSRKAMLDAYPELRAMYDENDGNTQVLFFKHAKAVFYSFTSAPESINI